MPRLATYALLPLVAALAACATNAPKPTAVAPAPEPAAPSFTLEETSVAELQRRMTSGELTARAIAQQYLDRIAAIDKAGPTLNAVIETNPDALAAADALDAERVAGKLRGPLHGVPVLLKDNIDTADAMQTSAGSLALVGAAPVQDAAIVAKLRAAGAVILGKTNLSEWANFRASKSTSGWSARGGQTRNPYVLDRNPCGSSSGSGAAIAANLAAVAVGTETDGSIVCPAGVNGLVGIKPTVGLVARSGIVPISVSQDTAGPMARSVADAAALLTAITGADPRDKASWDADKRAADYVRALDANALKGARIGVLRKVSGFHKDVDAAFERSIVLMRNAGATIVDGIEIANQDKTGAAELTVLQYEFKAGLNAYLATRRGVPIGSLAELVGWNTANADKELAWFGQDLLEASQQRGTLADKAYKEALATIQRYARKEGVDAVMKKHRLDALVAPTNDPAWTTDAVNGDHYTGGSSSIAAVAGYPSITVPMGQVRELPIGISFIGAAWSETTLIRIAYAFEQSSKARRAPKFLPTLP
jgi:amidase